MESVAGDSDSMAGRRWRMLQAVDRLRLWLSLPAKQPLVTSACMITEALTYSLKRTGGEEMAGFLGAHFGP